MGKAKAQQSQNWQKIYFCHSGSIPDQFRIDLRIAKVWGKAKALQSSKKQKQNTNLPKPGILWNFLCQKITESIPDQIRINLKFAKVWGKAKAQQSQNWQKIEFCHSGSIPDHFRIDLRIAKVLGKCSFFVHTCCIYHQIPKNMKFKDYKTSDLDDLNPEMNIGKIKWRQKYLEKIDKKITKNRILPFWINSGSIPDRPQNCKSMGKSKGPAILQKTETEHKPTQTWNFMEFPLPKNHRIDSGSNPDQPQTYKSTGNMLLFLYIPVAYTIRFLKIWNLKITKHQI